MTEPNHPGEQSSFYGGQPKPFQAPPAERQQWSYAPRPFEHSYVPPAVLPVETKSPLIALVCGILSWVGLWFFTAIPAIIFGVMGQREAREGRTTNGGMATAGLWLGIINIALSILVLIFFFVILAALAA